MTEPGARFGRFQLLNVLGRGGFATVYRAHDPALERDVALKTLLPHLADDPHLARRFLNEARAIARVHHPNIVTIFEAGEAEGHPYYTMELIDGQTLADELQVVGPLALERVLAILSPLAAALDHLHGAGLVHRDVKPANVMLGSGGRVLLMDFGIARVLEDTRFTQSGASLGTPAYMAPEQVLDQDVDPPADIYALGIVAYQLLAGRPPFTGATVQVLHAQAYEPPPALDELCPGLPERVYDVIGAALAKEPSRRPPSATLLVQQLGGTASPPVAKPPAAELLTAEMPAGQATIEETLREQPRPAEPATVEPAGPPLDETGGAGAISGGAATAGTTSAIAADGESEEAAPDGALQAEPGRASLLDETAPRAETGPVPPIDREGAAPAPETRRTEDRPQAAGTPPAPVSPGPPSRRSRIVLLAIGLAALLILGGGVAVWAANRGGGSGGDNNGTYTQVATDNQYSITRFSVGVGQPLKVTLRNNGQHQHNLHILVADSSGDEARTPVLQAGQSTTFTVVYNVKGSWAFRCDVFPTEMSGSITVN